MDCDPIRILDPLAAATVVKLHPQQQLWLALSPKLGVKEVDFDSRFFFLNRDFLSEDTVHTYVFEQKFDLSDWAKISCMYLGEIYIMRKDICACLSVILDSRFRPNILTIVNPISTQIKLRPNQILEIVALEPTIGETTHWDITVIPGSFGIKYEEIKDAVICPRSFNLACLDSIEDQLLPYPRVDDVGIEHHFWFKVRMESAFTWPSGLYDAGRIRLHGQTLSGKILTNGVDLNLRVKTKDRRALAPININSPKRCKWFAPMFEEISLEKKQSSSLFEGCTVVETNLKKKALITHEVQT